MNVESLARYLQAEILRWLSSRRQRLCQPDRLGVGHLRVHTTRNSFHRQFASGYGYIADTDWQCDQNYLDSRNGGIACGLGTTRTSQQRFASSQREFISNADGFSNCSRAHWRKRNAIGRIRTGGFIRHRLTSIGFANSPHANRQHYQDRQKDIQVCGVGAGGTGCGGLPASGNEYLPSLCCQRNNNQHNWIGSIWSLGVRRGNNLRYGLATSRIANCAYSNRLGHQDRQKYISLGG